ncbi:hypothetical protein PM082_014835 [Marasmius tenuissimus]|nr:hypothetical protein PM082_014835 [Marasmius tenuissimus]
MKEMDSCNSVSEKLTIGSPSLITSPSEIRISHEYEEHNERRFTIANERGADPIYDETQFNNLWVDNVLKGKTAGFDFRSVQTHSKL